MEPGATLLASKIKKLEKRLHYQREAGYALSPDSILKEMNDRVVFDMELKLFKLKHQARPAARAVDAPSP